MGNYKNPWSPDPKIEEKCPSGKWHFPTLRLQIKNYHQNFWILRPQIHRIHLVSSTESENFTTRYSRTRNTVLVPGQVDSCTFCVFVQCEPCVTIGPVHTEMK